MPLSRLCALNRQCAWTGIPLGTLFGEELGQSEGRCRNEQRRGEGRESGGEGGKSEVASRRDLGSHGRHGLILLFHHPFHPFTPYTGLNHQGFSLFVLLSSLRLCKRRSTSVLPRIGLASKTQPAYQHVHDVMAIQLVPVPLSFSQPAHPSESSLLPSHPIPRPCPRHPRQAVPTLFLSRSSGELSVLSRGFLPFCACSIPKLVSCLVKNLCAH